MNKTAPLSTSLSTSFYTAAALLAATLLATGCTPADQAEAATAERPAAQAANGLQAPRNTPVAIARGKIEVEDGLIELAPGLAGTVQEVLVKEGQQVERDQLLLRMVDDLFQADLNVAESEWQLAQTREKTKAAHLPPLKAMLSRWQTAEREGAADALNVDEAAQQLRDAQSEADVAKAEARVAQAKVAQLRAQQKRLELRAPDAGTVVRLTTHAGRQADPSQSVLSLLPSKPLIVRAEINESFANAVREGMRATVVIDGDSASSAVALPEAKVQRISPVFGPSSLQDDTQRGPVRIVESVLAFEQAPASARVGQNVRVSFYE